jgi:hypothetical protein
MNSFFKDDVNSGFDNSWHFFPFPDEVLHDSNQPEHESLINLPLGSENSNLNLTFLQGQSFSSQCEYHAFVPSSDQANYQSQISTKENQNSHFCIDVYDHGIPQFSTFDSSQSYFLCCGFYNFELQMNLISNELVISKGRLCDFKHHLVEKMLQKLSFSSKRKFTFAEVDDAVRYLPVEINTEIEKLYFLLTNKSQIVQNVKSKQLKLNPK